MIWFMDALRFTSRFVFSINFAYATFPFFFLVEMLFPAVLPPCWLLLNSIFQLCGASTVIPNITDAEHSSSHHNETYYVTGNTSRVKPPPPPSQLFISDFELTSIWSEEETDSPRFYMRALDFSFNLHTVWYLFTWVVFRSLSANLHALAGFWCMQINIQPVRRQCSFFFLFWRAVGISFK